MRLVIDWHRGKPYYCYASSNTAWSQAEYRRAYRSNADRLEQVVTTGLAGFLEDRLKLRRGLKTLGIYGQELDRLGEHGEHAAAALMALPKEAMEPLFTALTSRIEVGEEHLALDLRAIELRRFLEWDGRGVFRGRPADWPCSNARYVLDVPVCAVSAERWPVLHVKPRDGDAPAKPDRALMSLLERARTAMRLMEQNRGQSLESLSNELGCRPGHFSRLVRLNYLAPDIVVAIIDGTQPARLTKDVLLKANLPMDWALQRKLLGFPAPERSISVSNLYGRGMWPSAAAK
jgi:hypothetical protein